MAGGRRLRRTVFMPKDNIRVMVATYEQETPNEVFWETVIAGDCNDSAGGIVIPSQTRKDAYKMHDMAADIIRMIGLKEFKILRKGYTNGA